MIRTKLSKTEYEALDEAYSFEIRMGWKICGSRGTRLRTLRSLVTKGLLRECDELVVMFDGDGFLKQPERYRVGFELTDNGRALAISEEENRTTRYREFTAKFQASKAGDR